MYELYIANKNYSSWSLRPWVLMRELGISFAERLNPFLQDSSWETFRRFSPNGKVPCLHDRGTVVWDSLAIAEYLAERHDDVWPQASDARSWSRCAAAEMHAGFTALRECCPMNCGVRVQLHDMPLALLKDLARLEALWSEGLERFGGPFLGGSEFSAVDAFFAPVAFRVQTYELVLTAHNRAYVALLLKLPAMREWYAAAIAEPWRDEAHEAEIHRAGVCREDLRTPVRA